MRAVAACRYGWAGAGVAGSGVAGAVPVAGAGPVAGAAAAGNSDLEASISVQLGAVRAKLESLCSSRAVAEASGGFLGLTSKVSAKELAARIAKYAKRHGVSAGDAKTMILVTGLNRDDALARALQALQQSMPTARSSRPMPSRRWSGSMSRALCPIRRAAAPSR